MEQFTKEEINSILFYQGAVKQIELNNTEDYLREFYQIGNAYEAFNMLLFPGITNEECRIRDEQRKIPTIILDYMPEIMNVYCALYSAMCKYSYCQVTGENLFTYRSDRMNSVQFLRKGRTYSFLSTSLKKEGDEYFREKNGIALLEIAAPGSVINLNVNEVLGEKSIYPDEQEILFPPFLQIDIEEIDLTDEEKQYRDINNEMPKAKFKVIIKDSDIDDGNINLESVDLQRLYGEILEQKYIETAKKVWEGLFRKEILQDDVIQKYQEWKEKIQVYIAKRFWQIKHQIYGVRLDEQRRLELEQEIEVFYEETDKKRRKYKNQLKALNIVLSILYPLSSFAIAMSFVDNLELEAKIVGLLCSTIAAILGGIGTSLAIEGKWQQRTITYLRLDELRRDMKYESEWNRIKTNHYIQMFKDIIKADDSRCETNTQYSANYFKEIVKGKSGGDK